MLEQQLHRATDINKNKINQELHIKEWCNNPLSTITSHLQSICGHKLTELSTVAVSIHINIA